MVNRPSAPLVTAATASLTDVLREQVEILGGPLLELERDLWEPLAERIIELAPSVQTPSFPRVATQVVAMANEPDLDVNKLVGLVQRDGAIASAILRTANSAAFAPSTAITSLRGAVQHLGMQLVIEVTLGASARSYYEVATKAEMALYPALWPTMFEESMANGFASGALALDIPGARPERALFAGLLADIGRPIALRILSRIVTSGVPRPDEAVCLATLDEVAHRIGEEAIGRMELPDDLLQGCLVNYTDKPTPDALIARVMSSIAAMQRRSPRIWTNASDVRSSAEALELKPLLARTLFAQRKQYVLQAQQIFGTGGKSTGVIPTAGAAPTRPGNRQSRA